MDVKVVIKLCIISFRAICFAKHFALLQFLLCGDVHCLLARGKRKEPHSRELGQKGNEPESGFVSLMLLSYETNR